MPPSRVSSIREYMGRLVDNVRTLVPEAIGKWDEPAIHHARVSTRRLKAGLDLIGKQLAKRPVKRFARCLKMLRRSLGPLRDLDVMLGHLRDLGKEPARKSAVRWLTQILLAERKKLRAACRKKIGHGQLLAGLDAWEDMEDALEDLEPRMRAMLGKALPGQLAAFARDARQLTAGKGTLDVHGLRIEGKLLRYTLEIAAATRQSLPPRTAATFKKLQDALGLWHDYVVLAGQIMKSAAERQLALHDPALFESVLALLRTAWGYSQSHLRRFGQLWSRDGQKVAREIARLFPSKHLGNAGDST